MQKMFRCFGMIEKMKECCLNVLVVMFSLAQQIHDSGRMSNKKSYDRIVFQDFESAFRF